MRDERDYIRTLIACRRKFAI